MSREVGEAFQRMTGETKGRLHGYYVSLQDRYGDPRVYAAQEEQLRVRAAVASHAKAHTISDAMRSAYDAQQDRVDMAHKLRMSASASTPPGS